MNAHVSETHPVWVVGGGIAGTTVAWELKKRGVPVRLVEATPHVGGRIHTVKEGGGLVETGMQFYYGGYKQAKRLLGEVGLLNDLVPIHLTGHMYWDGRAHPFSKTSPWLGALSFTQNVKLQWSVARKLWALLRLSPFDYREGDPLDRVDVGTYFLEHGDEAILELSARALTTSYAFCEPEGHSLAMLLRILKLGGLYGIYGLRGGNDSLPRAMAEQLDVVHAKVTKIHVEDGHVVAIDLDREGQTETHPATTVVSAVRAPQAAEILGSVPDLARRFAELTYSTVILANLHLDRALPGPDWVWVHSRKAGHQAAFACDLLHRSPEMFPEGNSMVQVNFASPTSDALLAKTDDEIVAQALKDMEVFLPGLAAQVKHTSVVRRPRVIPDFAVGTFDKVRALQKVAARVEGLHLAGDYLKAPLCEGAVRSGLAAVEEMMAEPVPA